MRELGERLRRGGGEGGGEGGGGKILLHISLDITADENFLDQFSSRASFDVKA